MDDTDLYRHLLGVETPWKVSRVELSVKERRVDVWVEHARDQRWGCPECAAELALYDHAEERSWRHLDSCQFMTYLRARPPRVKCETHGVKQVKLPWAEPRSRFTAMFERLAIDVLKEMSVSGACELLRISWDEAWHLQERAVARGKARKQPKALTHIGVDEKAVAKGHTYMTVVCDLNTGTVEYLGEERKQASLDAFFTELTPERCARIEAVAMDMWDPFRQSVLAHVPDGESKIVYDRFHIMKGLNDAVNTVRKREHRALRAEGDERLVGTKYLWLRNLENHSESQRARFETLRAMNLKTGRAWALKESLRGFWSYTTTGWAARFWRRWYGWAMRSRLEPMKKAAQLLKRRLTNIMTYFKHRITNATAEGLNSKIRVVQNRARGFRNKQNFKTAVFFHCGGLDLYPTTHSIPG
jgi:transposase